MGISIPKRTVNQLYQILLQPALHVPETQYRDTILVTAISLTTVLSLILRIAVGFDLTILVLIVAAIIAYLLARTHYRKWAAVIIIAILTIPSLTNLVIHSPSLNNDPNDWVIARASWIALPMLLASVFFSWRGTLLTGIALTIGLTFSVFLNPNIEMINGMGSIAFLGILTALEVLSVRHRNAVEADRQNEILQVNRQLSDARNNLEKRVIERTAELNTALEIAERSEQAKSTFLASMSHELRTPLNSVINFTKFVVRGVMGPVNEKQADALNNVITSGQHLLGLINDILDMSKIESGSLNLFIEDDIQPNQIIDTVLTTCESLLHAKPVELRRDIQPDLPMMVGDRKRITQILLNVISNACKFTDEGSVTVIASANDGQLMVSVQDTGSGIADEDKEAVFAAFKQTDTGLRQGEGTGLGMPISKSLAEAHGGKLWFESELGKGSIFYIQLPIKTQIAEPVKMEI